jgi:hypothetical protein
MKKNLEQLTKAVLRLAGQISKPSRNIKANILFYSLEVFDKLTEKGLIFCRDIKETKGKFQPKFCNTEIKNLAFPLTVL